MNKVREYAKEVGFEVKGKLTRYPEYEYHMDLYTGKKVHSGYICYIDEAGNEYNVSKKGVCIVDADGGVI